MRTRDRLDQRRKTLVLWGLVFLVCVLAALLSLLVVEVALAALGCK